MKEVADVNILVHKFKTCTQRVEVHMREKYSLLAGSLYYPKEKVVNIGGTSILKLEI